ncbi:MAG: right-handed parallel beta-helix repeat-containing protein, partial [Thermoplasmata archaeon]
TLGTHNIEVEAGTYTENLVVNKAIVLTGSGKTITVIDGGGSGDVVRITVGWVTVTGFKITNSGAGTDDYGIELTGAQNCVVNNNELSGNKNDIFIDSTSWGNTISNNDIISANNGFGVVIGTSSHDNIISGNTVENHYQGIRLLDFSYSNDIISINTIRNNQIGIYLQDSDSNTISDNSIEDYTYYGIQLTSSSDGNYIWDNTLNSLSVGSGDIGIYLSGSISNEISGNTISENEKGICLESSSTGNTINAVKGFNLIENNDYGIYIDSSNSNTITGNKINSNNEDGIFVLSSDVNINDNLEINYNGRDGIHIVTSDVSINNNLDIYDNGVRGIYLDTCTGGIIGNTIWESAPSSQIGVKLLNSPGIVNVEDNNFIFCEIAVDTDPMNIILKNNIIQNCTYGINLIDSFAVITDNTITGCTYGIYCYNSDPIISDNVIEDNEYGIYVDHSSPTIEDNEIVNNHYGIFVGENSDPIINNNDYLNNTYDYYFLVWPVDIDPDTLNLKSQGRWITCYIEPTEGIDVSDVDLSSIRISEIGGIPVMIPAESHPTGIGDYDGNGIPDIMVKFDRSEVQDVAWPGDIEITVKGELLDGTPFVGYYTIRVIDPGR